MLDNNKFFDILFDKGQATSFAAHKKGTKVYQVAAHNAVYWAELFTINALHPTQDLKPTEEYHHADKPRRADHNVVCYRNILVEMDNMPVSEQLDFINDLGMPYSVATFSGSKSIHFIISLEEALVSEQEYRHLAERVHKALGGKDVVDTACKNPSRFSRFPGSARVDKNNERQTLLALRARVPNQTLLSWIESKIGPDVDLEDYAERMGKSYTNHDNTIRAGGTLNGFTLNLLMMGAAEGERNQSVFRAGCDFCKCGYDLDEAIDRISAAVDLPLQEVSQTVKSAYKKVERG